MSIIKCPECGNSVSTMAGSCPTCGVTIDGNLRKCPECGDYYLTSQKECPHCGYEIPAKKVIPHQYADEKPERPHKTVQRKQHSHWPLFFTLLFIIIAGGCGYYYLLQQSKLEQEEKDFQALQEVTIPSFYQDFLNRYPLSKHTAEVRMRMMEIEKEQEEWESVLLCDNPEKYRSFVQQHPTSHHIRECEAYLDSVDWEQAVRDTTEDGLLEYLKLHPEGRHVEEASEQHNTLARSKVTAEDKGLIVAMLDTFFNQGIAQQDTTQIASCILGSMEQCQECSQASPQEIILQTIQELHLDDAADYNFDFTKEFHIRRTTLTDGNLGFVVDFLLQATPKQQAASAETNTSLHQVNLTLTGDTKIQKMRIQ